LDLGEGQQFYRSREKDDTATVFIAEGEVQRSKGDQVAIECCTGKALLDGNLKAKSFEDDKVYVVNHESDTIYNDVVTFNAKEMDKALSQFATYPAGDATIVVRGKDGKLLQRKGDELYIAQDLAYLYNDSD
jgi:hypothetical protein